jgi:hypothetical protein
MRNRTADLLLTMETLCLLSYRGARMPRERRHQRTKIHTASPPVRIQWQPGDRRTLVSPEQSRWSLPSLHDRSISSAHESTGPGRG